MGSRWILPKEDEITRHAKLLLNRLNHLCKRSLDAAAGQCVSRGHYEVSIEHFLLQLLDDPKSDICMALAYFEIDPARIRKSLQRILEGFRSGNPGKPVFSPLVLDWLQDAWLIGSVDLRLSSIQSIRYSRRS